MRLPSDGITRRGETRLRRCGGNGSYTLRHYQRLSGLANKILKEVTILEYDKGRRRIYHLYKDAVSQVTTVN